MIERVLCPKYANIKRVPESSFNTVVMILLSCLVVLCIPLSFPSLYLAQRLCRKRFLKSVFNQHVALMMIFSGIRLLHLDVEVRSE